MMSPSDGGRPPAASISSVRTGKSTAKGSPPQLGRAPQARVVCALAFSVAVLGAGPIYAAGAEQAIVYSYMRGANPLTQRNLGEPVDLAGL
jgi:hypothetical protein